MVIDPVIHNENYVFDIATEFITRTGRCVFLTGKAGTGKTTFLRKITKTSGKKCVVVAPTGVAAINAGGTTIHSFFQLPFTPFVPKPSSEQGALFECYSLLQNIRIDQEKKNLFRELELLIIDEISMVRCDVLDSIDVILRHFRRREKIPFGGVQVLLIGDLFQLPPVVQPGEWKILGNFYDSAFFFDAHVMKKARPLYIELKKIFRQTDVAFIDLLNKVRNNEARHRELEMLNARFRPDFNPEPEEGYITLSTHNAKADKINADALNNLPGNLYSFDADVEGDFPERSFPTERSLLLKEGAQVMFIKNDVGPFRRYYNGKLARVVKISPESIIVTFSGEHSELKVEKETWRNVRFNYNPVTGQVEEEVLGVFTQYALRLAWAITIHKSQGLTFDKVVIDAGYAFAPGQVYVALSRCTSLEGIVLCSRIFSNAIRTDPRILEFAEEACSDDELKPVLASEQRQHNISKLLMVFDWSIPLEEVRSFGLLLGEKTFLDQQKADEMLTRVEQTLHAMQGVTEKFSLQIQSIAGESDYALLMRRVEAGISYFNNTLQHDIVPVLKEYDAYLKSCKKVKRIRKRLNDLIQTMETMGTCFERARAIATTLLTESV